MYGGTRTAWRHRQKNPGFKIALNQDGFLKGIADVDLKGRDLRQVLRALPPEAAL